MLRFDDMIGKAIQASSGTRGQSSIVITDNDVTMVHNDFIAKKGTHKTYYNGTSRVNLPNGLQVVVSDKGEITLDKGYFKGDKIKIRQSVRFFVNRVIGLEWISKYDNIALKLHRALNSV